MSDLLQETAEGLRRIAAAEKVSFSAWSKLAGCARANIYDLVSGRRNATLRTLRDVAKAIGYTIEIRFNKAEQSNTTVPEASEGPGVSTGPSSGEVEPPCPS